MCVSWTQEAVNQASLLRSGPLDKIESNKAHHISLTVDEAGGKDRAWTPSFRGLSALTLSSPTTSLLQVNPPTWSPRSTAGRQHASLAQRQRCRLALSAGEAKDAGSWRES